MSEPLRDHFLPGILDPSYWQTRIDAMRAIRPGLLQVPREDLSSPLIEVTEFRVRTHDGQRLWGLVARPVLCREDRPVRIHMVSACSLPLIDSTSVLQGSVEVVFQSPVGRRLEDRVLDVIRITEVASGLAGVDTESVSLIPGDSFEDEFHIAASLDPERLTFGS